MASSAGPKALVLVVHAYGGSPRKFWYPRLCEHVGDLADVEVIRMTNPSTPCIAVWLEDLEHRVSKLAAAAAAGGEEGARDPDQQQVLYLVGHSVGCQTIIRFLAKPSTTELFKGIKVGGSAGSSSGRCDGNRVLRLGGCLLVAAWFEVVDPWEGMLPWCQTPVDCNAARSTLALAGGLGEDDTGGMISPPCLVLLSDNDRYTPDTNANAARWRDSLGASVRVLPGRAHFGSKNQPDVMQAARQLIVDTL